MHLVHWSGVIGDCLLSAAGNLSAWCACIRQHSEDEKSCCLIKTYCPLPMSQHTKQGMGKLMPTRAPTLNVLPKYQKGCEQLWAAIQTRQANYTSCLAWEQCARMCQAVLACVILFSHAQSHCFPSLILNSSQYSKTSSIMNESSNYIPRIELLLMLPSKRVNWLCAICGMAC